jgi:hypothetical protein
MTLSEVTAGAEDGFADLRLTLISIQHDPDGAQTITAGGLHRGRPIGFAVNLGSTWEEQGLEETNDSIYWGRADLVSLGNESDAFLQVLDEVYETNAHPRTMRDKVTYVAVSLAGHPLRLEHEPVKMKLFFEAETEDRAAEFFLNIDAQSSSVEFHEKDKDYRRAIVLSLVASIS